MNGPVYYAVQLTDEDVATLLWSTANVGGGARGATPYQVVVAAVAAGRLLGGKVALPPLDDAVRGLPRDLIGFVQEHDPGRVGLTDALYRLDRLLDTYPARGRPDLPGAGPAADSSRPFPEVDVTKSPHPLVQHIALSRQVLNLYASGDGPFTLSDARRMVGVLERWWAVAPPGGDVPMVPANDGDREGGA